MMSDIDKLRLEVEKQIDEFVKEPRDWEEAIKEYLNGAAVFPDLEAILSMMLGITYGYVIGLAEERFHRKSTSEENKRVRELIQRRAPEIRETIILDRYR